MRRSSTRARPERSRRVEELPADLGNLEAALLAWNRVYETLRPHQALGYLAPHQSITQWYHQQGG